jgi:DNA-binding NarL/FixJ family response regulator
MDALEKGEHICLAGAGVTNNWSLIEPLKRRRQVTVIERPRMLFANSILATVSVLVLDCGEEPRWGLNAVKALRRVYPDVHIVLVNGGLSPAEIAEAFREGVRDYFSHQSNAELVVERVESLCRQARRGIEKE